MTFGILFGAMLALGAVVLLITRKLKPQAGSATQIKDLTTGQFLTWNLPGAKVLMWSVAGEVAQPIKNTIIGAFDAWNEATGARIFIRAEFLDPGLCDVEVKAISDADSEATSPETAAYVRYYHRPESQQVNRVVIYLTPYFFSLSSDAQKLVITHEVGHVLLLGDVRDPVCIMNSPNPTAGPSRAEIALVKQIILGENAKAA